MSSLGSLVYLALEETCRGLSIFQSSVSSLPTMLSSVSGAVCADGFVLFCEVLVTLELGVLRLGDGEGEGTVELSEELAFFSDNAIFTVFFVAAFPPWVVPLRELFGGAFLVFSLLKARRVFISSALRPKYHQGNCLYRKSSNLLSSAPSGAGRQS